MKKVLINMEDALYNNLLEHSKLDKRSMSSYIRLAIEEKCLKHELDKVLEKYEEDKQEQPQNE